MSNNLRKFVSPKFTRTIDPDLMVRLFERHRHLLGPSTFTRCAAMPRPPATRCEAFFAGRRNTVPKASSPICTGSPSLARAHGLRLLLAQAARLGIVIPPESRS